MPILGLRKKSASLTMTARARSTRRAMVVAPPRARGPLVAAAVVATTALVGLLSSAARGRAEQPTFRIYYGSDLARANPLLRMCAEAKAACEWVTDVDKVKDVVSCREGDGSHHLQGRGTGDTFAPPVLEDLSAPHSRLISQSVAASLYLAERLGFGVGAEPYRVGKAVQYMTDLNDLESELIGRYGSARAGDGWERMRAFNDGGRLASWLGNIERSIEGPFYFGKKLSAPDFYLVGVMGYFEVMDPASPAALLADYPKARAVFDAVQALPSWAAWRALGQAEPASEAVILPRALELTQAQLDAYAKTKA